MLDLSVVDHLQRIDAGKYQGENEVALRRLRVAAERRSIDVWICEISFVEMLHGIEKLAGNEQKQRIAASKDAAKDEILRKMFARKLGYPCSRFDDTYSRFDLSFRFAGPDSEEASLLEARLLTVPGVSPGDARQLVSCAFPFDGNQVELHPMLDWFVTEDRALITGVRAVSSGQLEGLSNLRFGTAHDLITAHPNEF